MNEVSKEDVLNVTGGILDTMLDYADNSQKEIEELQQRIEKVKELRNILNNETLDMLPFDIAEQVQDLFDEILINNRNNK